LEFAGHYQGETSPLTIQVHETGERMTKQILFVTHQNDDIEDAFSYAVDLAKALDEAITILIVSKKKFLDKFSDLMVAVTFAEADDHETAREILIEGDHASKNAVMDCLKKFKGTGVNIKVLTSAKDAVAAVNDLLKQKNNVDMVLLSPGITSNGEVTAKEIQRLVRIASRPIVTMAKNAYAV
jgi:hypothetical protein